MKFPIALIAAALMAAPRVVLAQEPTLPSGLGEAPKSEAAKSEEPSLPSGLGGGSESIEDETRSESALVSVLELGGFFEVRWGSRTSQTGLYQEATLAEARLQLEGAWSGEHLSAQVTADFIADDVAGLTSLDLEAGTGWIDLREASLQFSPVNAIDLKLGRQILTWGTGDLIFINDLFPKDWNAFFIGRDDEYLKAPSDALKASVFLEGVTVDLVYTPRFDPDRYIDGNRLTFFNPLAGELNRVPAALPVDLPDDYGGDGEGALRISGNFKSFEWGLYGYYGRWKSPVGYDALSGLNTFPRLNVYGASLRGPVAGGIANVEMGYYEARDDGAASDPFIPNDELRFLAGFEREVVRDLTAGVQVYVEHMVDHDAYLASLPPGMSARDETRSLLTLRLTRFMLNQNLQISGFNFWSPTDEDGYLRLKVNYKLSDAWALEAGGNIFYGKEDWSFFGQFKDNTNLFLSARMSF